MVEIEELLKYEAAGDPMTGTKWMRTTPQKIAEILNARGFTISRNTVAAMLLDMDFSLKANRKTIATSSSPDRDQQFGIIQGLRKSFEASGNPILSVDTKKKELIGLFANSGRVWTRKPIATNDHDFRSDAKAIAVPYGLYSMWGRSTDSLALVDEARARGIDVTMDQYPYTASSTGLTILFPSWSLEGSRDDLLARLDDPVQRQRIKDGIIATLRDDRGGNDPNNVVLARCSWDSTLDGMSLAEVLSVQDRQVNLATAADQMIPERSCPRAVRHELWENHAAADVVSASL